MMSCTISGAVCATPVYKYAKWVCTAMRFLHVNLPLSSFPSRAPEGFPTPCWILSAQYETLHCPYMQNKRALHTKGRLCLIKRP